MVRTTISMRTSDQKINLELRAPNTNLRAETIQKNENGKRQQQGTHSDGEEHKLKKGHPDKQSSKERCTKDKKRSKNKRSKAKSGSIEG
jgi:hypothetical protein